MRIGRALTAQPCEENFVFILALCLCELQQTQACMY